SFFSGRRGGPFREAANCIAALPTAGPVVENEGARARSGDPRRETLHLGVVMQLVACRRRRKRPYDLVRQPLGHRSRLPLCPHCVRDTDGVCCRQVSAYGQRVSRKVGNFPFYFLLTNANTGALRVWSNGRKLTLNQRVAGSSPAAPTNVVNHLSGSWSERFPL